MFSKRKIAVIMTVLSVLCVVLSLVLVSQLTILLPKTSFLVPITAKPSEKRPDWLIANPQLSFLLPVQAVSIVKGKNDNVIFALNQIENPISHNTSNYEIWMVTNSPYGTVAIESGSTDDFCGGTNISISKTNKHMVSSNVRIGCDSGIFYTEKYYDLETGALDYLLTYDRDTNGNDTAGTASVLSADNKKQTFSITSEFTGNCDTQKYLTSGQKNIPEITFNGITVISSSGGKKKYTAPKNIQTKCVEEYGESIGYPGVNEVQLLDDGKFRFFLPFSVTITIDPANQNALPVFGEYKD
jgi:hypothetical protein